VILSRKLQPKLINKVVLQEKFTHGAITPTNLPIAVTNGYHKGSVLALSAMEDDLAVSQVRIPFFFTIIWAAGVNVTVYFCHLLGNSPLNFSETAAVTSIKSSPLTIAFLCQ
jgi:hypothetical protein